ncbi:MAG: alpha/beta hydrolase [Oscillospiraceae bacterium]|nr:alpha/beta hydrolase [Oscillospiraceae bacterium]
MDLFDPSRAVSFRTDGLSIYVYPNGGRALYVFGGERDARSLFSALGGGVSIIAIDGADWNRDLSPWPAPKVFKSGGDFGGGADALIEKIGRIVPLCEEVTGPQDLRAFASYSLGGLFALYCIYKTELFCRAASVSGSLWFDGFTDFMADNTPHAGRVYLSLGDREKHARSPRMGCVEDRTREAADILRAAGVEVTFELNPGGHFTQPGERLAKGAKAIMAP